MIGLVLGAVLNGSCALVAWLRGDIVLRYDSFNVVYAPILFVCVFVQSSAEELICRGYLYQKPMIAIVGNAVLFAAFHLLNPGVTLLSFMDTVVCGLLFSLMVYCSDSIWMAMAAHTAWNYLQNIVLGLPNSGRVMPYAIFKLDTASARNGFAYTTDFGIEGSVMAILVQVAAIAAFLYLIKKNGAGATNIWAAQCDKNEIGVELKNSDSILIK